MAFRTLSGETFFGYEGDRCLTQPQVEEFVAGEMELEEHALALQHILSCDVCWENTNKPPENLPEQSTGKSNG